MGEWHRDNPDLCGTDADPWMQNAGHRAAYDELRRAGLIYTEADADRPHEERCNKCGGLFELVDGGVVPTLRCQDCGREIPRGAMRHV